MDGVGLTSLWVAAVRALETEREGGLFRDPFARALADERGFDVLARARAANPLGPPVLEIRTRWLDEQIALAAPDRVVMLAAGMDARAYRLDALAGARVWELDRAEVLAHKRAALEGAKPQAERIEIPIDLRDDWPAALLAAGFDRARPAVFVAEGLLVYLEASHARALLARIDALAAPGSVLLFDVTGRSALESPFMKGTLAFVESLGAPWRFGTDEPESLLPSRWRVEAFDFGVVGASYGRWPYALAPRGTPGVPRSFLVRAVVL